MNPGNISFRSTIKDHEISKRVQRNRQRKVEQKNVPNNPRRAKSKFKIKTENENENTNMNTYIKTNGDFMTNPRYLYTVITSKKGDDAQTHK